MKLENCFIGQIVRHNANMYSNPADGKDQIGKIGYISGLDKNCTKEVILKVTWSDGETVPIHPYHVDPLKE